MALVAVLLTLGALSALGVALGASARGAADLTRNLVAQAQGEALADGAIRRAILAWIAAPDAWPANGIPRPVLVGGTAVLVEIQDINGLIDINEADEALLTGWLRVLGVAEPGPLARRVIDWRDPNDISRNGGSKAAYYRSQGLPPPGSRPYELVEELALVAGFPPLLIKEAGRSATVLARRYGIDPMTAPLAALLAVPGMDASEARDWVLRRQPGGAPPLGDSPAARRYFQKAEPQLLRLTARAEIGPATVIREATFRLTGDPAEPFWVQLWRGRAD